MKQKQIFEITDAAATQIIKSAEDTDSKDWPLRIAVSVDNDGKYNYMMGFDQSKEEDLRLRIRGKRYKMMIISYIFHTKTTDIFLTILTRHTHTKNY